MGDRYSYEVNSRGPACTCCGGTGNVLDIHSQPRPCSLCRHDAFSAWYKARLAAEQFAQAIKNVR